HYYIGFKEVGRRLTDFHTTYELITAIKDAIKGNVAYEEAKILHCDISSGNILISEDGKSGFLIDWEFSVPVGDPETPRQHMRTLLLEDETYNERADDLESFFHVLCYVLLKHGPHTLKPTNVVELLEQEYDYEVICEGQTTGGTHKKRALKARVRREEAGLPVGCLKNLVVDFEDLVAVRYDNRPSSNERERYNKLAAAIRYNDALLDTHPVWKYDKSS
ncbi:hypothetical protein MPER_04741, partial [Moniliophthora perniciosa FA553]